MTPTPSQILAARLRANLTQADAARLAGYSGQSRWSEIETGARRISAARWELFLHKSGLAKIPFDKR